MCTPHLAETEIDGVEQGGAAPGGSEHQAALQVLHAVGERTSQFSALIEADEEKFILGIRGLEELDRSFAGFAHFVGHAAAKIKNHTNGNGHDFGGEVDDFLLDVVLEDAEVVLLETGDQAIVRVGDGNVDEREVHVHVNLASGFERRARGVFLYVILLDLVLFRFFALGIVFGFVFVRRGRGLSQGGEGSLRSKKANHQQDAE